MFKQNTLFSPSKNSNSFIPAHNKNSNNEWWGKGLFYATYNVPNQTQIWNPSDTEETYKKAVARFKARNKQYPWTPDSFDYKFNSYGFRGPEPTVTADFKILVSGCSFTEGIGLPYETTWPERLAAKIPGAVAVNLGQGGHSCDYTARSIYKTLEIIKPDLVAILWPPKERYEDIIKKSIMSVAPNDDRFAFARLYTNEDYIEYQYQKNVLLVQHLCDTQGVQFISFPSEMGLPLCDRQQYPLARDDMHPGPGWQQAVADKMYELFQSGRSTA